MFRQKRRHTHRPKHYRKNKESNVFKHWSEKHGTTSEWAGVIIGAVVGVFTVALFFQTQRSTDAAIQAAQAADSSLQLSKQQFELAKEDGKTSDQRAERTFSMQKKSVDSSIAFAQQSIQQEKEIFAIQRRSVAAQIQSLNEARKNFETENRPFVTIMNVVLDTIFAGGKYHFGWHFFNTGKFPAKMLNITTRIGFGFDTSQSFKSPYTTNVLNNLLPSGQNIGAPYFAVGSFNNMPSGFADETKNALKTGRIKAFLFGEYQYQSAVLRKTYSNKFVIEIKFDEDARNYSWLKNDEIEF